MSLTTHRPKETLENLLEKQLDAAPGSPFIDDVPIRATKPFKNLAAKKSKAAPKKPLNEPATDGLEEDEEENMLLEQLRKLDEEEQALNARLARKQRVREAIAAAEMRNAKLRRGLAHEDLNAVLKNARATPTKQGGATHAARPAACG